MIQCPKCSAENPPDNKFCGSCGEQLSSVSQMPTMEAPEAESPPTPVQTPHVGRIVSSDSVPAGGFTPGTILADRYRIIGLLGRGGMGEVYRADDLKLGQPVALKFLPPALAEDSVRRERFFAEVRITRQLSHPNICRVYDIGEVDGRHFLSMEYIDGEDLASLMKRIGSLTNEKALDIARQLVAGLSVAHERGVLHRDLKPANIMLDGHGRVRITDFGLAIAVGDESQAEEIAGTPAYMAPEQLAGKGATVRSDIYSLGLILYEIYTGKKAFKANTLAELREQKETQTPRAPSELREGIDPVVERVIQRCMEKDPGSRPASVAQLAQALPGGDPLAAAIAAGETPSPEMVAASGSKEGLKPWVAWGLLVFIIIGMLGIIWMDGRIMLHRRIPFEKGPEALVERSKIFLKSIGYPDNAAFTASGYVYNEDLLNYIQESDKTADRWKKLNSKSILFWYRQSPRYLMPVTDILGGRTGPEDPPLQFSGEIRIIMDTEGYLVSFHSIPFPEQSSTESIQVPDWNVFFSEAGLDKSQWNPVEDSQLSQLSYANTWDVWQGRFANWPDVPARIEAAAFQGKPVSFDVIGHWNKKKQTEPTQINTRDLFALIGGVLWFLPALAGGLYFARKNMKLGRGDRRRAIRLSFFVLALSVSIWILNLPGVSFITLLLSPYVAGLTWIFYMAIEPFVRRRWPHILVSWTRLLSGSWRDPLAASDMLVGFAAGVFNVCLAAYMSVVPSWFFERPIYNISLYSVTGSRYTVAQILSCLQRSIVIGLIVVCSLIILRILLRNKKAAAIAFIALCTMMALSMGYAGALLFSALGCFLVLRFGLVTSTVWYFTFLVFMRLPTNLQVSAWYSGYGYLTLAIFAAIVLYAFHTSLGGRPMFGTPRLDE